MANNKENLFVYGTLRDREIQKSVFGRIAVLKPTVLEGYSKSEIVVDGMTYPALIPDKNNFVEGFVMSVTPKELELIDEYETNAYRRVMVFLRSKQKAWVYIKA